MKANIHPIWYKDAKVICVCGNSFTSGSTLPEIRVELCSNCHPFYTGQQKLVDTQGQVDRFQRVKAASEIKKQELAQIQQQRAAKAQKAKLPDSRPSLKDLLMQARKRTAS